MANFVEYLRCRADDKYHTDYHIRAYGVVGRRHGASWKDHVLCSSGAPSGGWPVRIAQLPAGSDLCVRCRKALQRQALGDRRNPRRLARRLKMELQNCVGDGISRFGWTFVELCNVLDEEARTAGLDMNTPPVPLMLARSAYALCEHLQLQRDQP